MLETQKTHRLLQARALEYLDKGDIINAVTSMLSDLSKHPETKALGDGLALMGVHIIARRDRAAAQRFIEGFS
jgi:hypothetical protein